MSDSSNFRSLLLTTLISIVGWIGVTLYSSDGKMVDKVQSIDLRLTTLEVTQYKPVATPMDKITVVSSEIKQLENQQEKLEDRVDLRIDAVERRLDILLMQSFSRKKEQ